MTEFPTQRHTIMSVSITNPDAFSEAGDPELANGSFEFYRPGTNERRFAKRNAECTLDAPFQNTLNANSRPVQALWVASVADLDIAFRNAANVELYRGPLSTYLDKLIVVTSGGASSAEVTASIAGSLNQYTKSNIATA